MAEASRQVMVGVREAAQLAGVSTKQVRKWILAGKVRAELQEGKFGPTWSIEAASLPFTQSPIEEGRLKIGQGVPTVEVGGKGDNSRGDTGAMQALIAMLSDLQRRHEGAVVRLGQLEGEREQRLALEARNLTLQEQEALTRAEAEQLRQQHEAEQARAEQLSQEIQTLQQRIKWRTWIAASALFATSTTLLTIIIKFVLK